MTRQGKKMGLRKYFGWSLTGSKNEEKARTDLKKKLREREKE
jgi:hypothetical protein